MRNTVHSSKSWQMVYQTFKRQVSTSKVFPIALSFSLLVGLAIALLSYPSLITTAQEQKIAAPSAASSLVDAERAGVDTKMVTGTLDQNIQNAPEGGSCTWTSDTVIPIPILDQATASVGGNLYTFGGVSTAIIATAYKFDGTTWTTIAPLPAALEFPTAVSDGTSIYILGGALTGTGAPQTTLYRYNPGTNDYTTLAPFTTPTWNQAAAYLNGKIYKFAGTSTSASTNALEIYTISTNSWATGANYPESDSFVSAFARGNFIYGAGGIASVGSVASLKTYRYDPAGNTWDDASIADLPDTRWGAATSTVGYGANGGWVLAGGYVAGTATNNISTSVIRWDPASNTWLSLAPLTGERARMTGAIRNGAFHVIGGRSIASSAFVGTNDNQKLFCLSGVAVINSGTSAIVTESCGTPNGAPDPGETLTVSLPLTNSGDTATVNLTATLAATGGVTNPTPASQNYGAIAPGATVTRNFTFVVDPALLCGNNVTLTFTLTDGATSYGTVTKTFQSGSQTVSLSQNFDGVTAPALPSGWTSVQTSGTGINWVTTTTTPNSAPNAAFASDPAAVNAAALVSPAVAITSASAQLQFKNQYTTESTFDGEVLEYSTDGGTTWTDVITGGGTFVSGGYNATISTSFMSPIGGRMAWSGSSSGYVTTLVNLPAALNGQSVKFRWLMASDSSVSATGVWVDDVQVLGGRTCNGPCLGGTCQLQRRDDFNGDGKTDYAVFRPSTSTWYIQPNGAGSASGVSFGASGDKLQPADFDGDGKTDLAVYRPSTGVWYWIRSSDGAMRGYQFGTSTDIPVAGDYSGDGKAELAVYRPSTGVWYSYNTVTSAMSAVTWGGAATDVPVVGDFDGDCKIDYAVRRTTGENGAGSTRFYILQSGGGATSISWGRDDMAMAIGDYNGDLKSDIGVVDTQNSQLKWYVIGANGSVIVNGTQFGSSGDVVAAGDYDGDQKTDLAVFRNGTFYYRGSVSGTQSTYLFGAAGDIPTARANQYPLP